MSDTYRPSTYGDRIADVYDSDFGRNTTDLADTVELLAQLAGDGPALELGIGTGRVALPLREQGVAVHGIDASEAMVAKLRSKPAGADLPVTIGDMADVGVAGTFALVYVVWNTFFGILSQDDQVKCFANVAARLAPGGAFLIEAFVPDPCLFPRGHSVTATRVEVNGVLLGASNHYKTAQVVESQHIQVTESGVKLYPVSVRYAYPPELDLMARLAGLALRDRWSGWQRQRFGDDAQMHVSVWVKPG